MDDVDSEVYRKHADDLVRFATSLVGPSLAEDVVANAVLRAMSAPSWSAVLEQRPYLFRCVLNEARSLARSDRRRVHREEAAAAPEAISDGLASIEVRDAMRALSWRQRAVIHLAYWHDMTVTEIADTLGISKRTAERDLLAGRTKLEEALR